MAVPFKSPRPRYVFDPADEIKALNRHFRKRGVPRRTAGHLLLASFNIANLGAQGRTDEALAVLAHMARRFDLIAMQEINANYHAFVRLVEEMGPGYDFLLNDTAGNSERLAFVYRTRRVAPTQLCGELALREREFPKRTVRVRYRQGGADKVEVFRDHRFVPFDRNPFLASFRAGEIDFTLANVHLYFGSFQNSRTKKERARYARRVLEIYALARWASRVRRRRAEVWDKDIILLGDMNIPVMDPSDAAFKALKAFGFEEVKYIEKGKTGGSNLNNDKTYDQVAIAPGGMSRRVRKAGVFDFDNAVFKPLWERLNARHAERKATALFNRHVRHNLTDHRPVWVQLKVV